MVGPSFEETDPMLWYFKTCAWASQLQWALTEKVYDTKHQYASSYWTFDSSEEWAYLGLWDHFVIRALSSFFKLRKNGRL